MTSFNLERLTKELGVPEEELHKRLQKAGCAVTLDFDKLRDSGINTLLVTVGAEMTPALLRTLNIEEIDLTLDQLKIIMGVHSTYKVPEAPKPVHLEPKPKTKQGAAHAKLSVLAVAKRLNIGRASLTNAIRRKLVAPARTEVGPKGRRMHYFTHEAMEHLVKQQHVLKSAGYLCIPEIAEWASLTAPEVAKALKGSPTARDGYLLRTKGTPGYARPHGYYHPRAYSPLSKKKAHHA